jgi:type IV fimbrial biogenesis protein FimT
MTAQDLPSKMAACAVVEPAMSPLPSTKTRRRLQRGITLLECCVCLSILCILVGSAVPSFASMLDLQRLRGMSATLVGDLHLMRSEAIVRNADVRMSFHAAGGGSCYVVHTGPASACSCTSAGQAQCSGGRALLLSARHWQAQGAQQVAANVNSILFDPRIGTASPGGTVRLTDSAGREIRHIVNLRGRVRTCSAQGAMAEHPAC